jgi:hypothetical protein
MAKFTIRMVALLACLTAASTVPGAAQSAVNTTEVAVCSDKKWDNCSLEQRLASVKSFCDTTKVTLKDSDKVVLAKASRADFLATLDCAEEEPVRVADVRFRGPLVIKGPTVVRNDGDLDRQLAQRALQVLGPAPTHNHTFQGVKRRAEPAPRGCTREARRVQGGTYYRVVCP